MSQSKIVFVNEGFGGGILFLDLSESILQSGELYSPPQSTWRKSKDSRLLGPGPDGIPSDPVLSPWLSENGLIEFKNDELLSFFLSFFLAFFVSSSLPPHLTWSFDSARSVRSHRSLRSLFSKRRLQQMGLPRTAIECPSVRLHGHCRCQAPLFRSVDERCGLN